MELLFLGASACKLIIVNQGGRASAFFLWLRVRVRCERRFRRVVVLTRENALVVVFKVHVLVQWDDGTSEGGRGLQAHCGQMRGRRGTTAGPAICAIE